MSTTVAAAAALPLVSVADVETKLKRMHLDPIYWVIHKILPHLAGKITGMFAELSLEEIRALTADSDFLASSIKEALDVLDAHKAELQSTSTSAASGGQVIVRLAADDVAPLGSASIAAAPAPVAAYEAAFPPLIPAAGECIKVHAVDFHAASIPSVPSPAEVAAALAARIEQELALKAKLASILPVGKPDAPLMASLWFMLLGLIDNARLRELGIYGGRKELIAALYPTRKYRFPDFPGHAIDGGPDSWAADVYEKDFKEGLIEALSITPAHFLWKRLHHQGTTTLRSLPFIAEMICEEWTRLKA